MTARNRILICLGAVLLGAITWRVGTAVEAQGTEDRPQDLAALSRRASGETAEDPLSIQSRYPLLAAWRNSLFSHERPAPVGELRQWHRFPLKPVKWSEDIVMYFRSRIYNNYDSVMSTLHYYDISSADPTPTMFWVQDGEVRSYDKDSFPRPMMFLDNSTFPMVLRVPVMPDVPDPRNIQPIPGTLARLLPGLTRLEAEPVASHMGSVPEPHHIMTYDLTHLRTSEDFVFDGYVFDRHAGRVVSGPLRLKANIQTNVRRLGDSYHVGGLRLVGQQSESETEADIAHGVWWCRSEAGSLTWNITHHAMTPDEHAHLLPSSLGQFRRLYDHKEDLVRVWRDGSLIYRVRLARIQNEQGRREALGATLLVRHKPHQKAELLYWTMSYRGQREDPATGRTTTEPELAEMHNRIWFPQPDGSIGMTRETARPDSQLLFDVDHTNNAIIFLLEGRIWTMRMPS